MSGDSHNTMIIGPEVQSMIDAVLTDILDRCPAVLVALATSDGRPISLAGRHEGLNTAGICALAAAEMAASQELAGILDDQDACQAVLREGRRSNLMIHEVDASTVLLVVAPRSQTIGWVRIVVQEAVDKLRMVARRIGSPWPAQEIPASPVQRTEVGQALDDIWVEGDVH